VLPARPQRLVPLSQPSLGGFHLGPRNANRAVGFLEAASRHGPLGEEQLGPLLFRFGRAQRGPRLGDLLLQQRPIFDARQSGLETGQQSRCHRHRWAARRQAAARPPQSPPLPAGGRRHRHATNAARFGAQTTVAKSLAPLFFRYDRRRALRSPTCLAASVSMTVTDPSS
jgi:hypothetical protein